MFYWTFVLEQVLVNVGFSKDDGDDVDGDGVGGNDDDGDAVGGNDDH